MLNFGDHSNGRSAARPGRHTCFVPLAVISAACRTSARDVASSRLWRVAMGIDRRRFLQVASLVAAVSTISRATKAEPASLEVVVWGSGPRVVLVHGSVQNGPMTWKDT